MGDFNRPGAGRLTALVFFCCSSYGRVTRKKTYVILGEMLMAGVVVVLIGMVANLFLQLRFGAAPGEIEARGVPS